MRTLLLPALVLATLAAPPRAALPAELIVGLAPLRPGATTAAQRLRFEQRLAALGLTARGTLADGLASGRDPAPRPNPFDLDPARVWRVAARDSLAALAAVAALGADPGIEWIEPNRPREAAVVSLEFADAVAPAPHGARARALEPGFPNDPMFRDTRQWALRNVGRPSAFNGTAGADIRALAAWSVTTGSNRVRLAIADTGVDPDHPEVQARMPDGGMRIVDGINVTLDPVRTYADSAGHGVAVAGVMAARTNEGWHLGDSLGVAGVCGGDGAGNLGCRLVPIKIAPGHSNTATSFDIARAMVYSVEVGARAMNLSFAGDGPSRVERMAMYYAITRGCVVVAAAGNQGFLYGTKPQYPAAYAADGLGIQVGASDMNDVRSLFSSYGPGLDLVAPGQSIQTTYMTYPHPVSGLRRNGYVVGSGTSFAAPHVAGAVGLLAALRPELADADFQRILRESADDIGDPGVDARTGWGRLNLARALAAVDPALGIWHDEALGRVARVGRTDTLVLTESGPGTFDRWRSWRDATEYEVRATITVPDSFAGPFRVWPRVGGTMTVRGDFRIPYFTPWSELVAQDGRSFTLRGFLYRQSDATCAPCGDDAWLPLPPDQARFGFTVIGPVRRAAGPADAAGDPPAIRVRIVPNPFAATARIEPPGPGRVEILDTAGRRVRRAAVAGGSGGFEWDGRDERGRAVRPGLYFVRFEGEAGRALVRIVKLEAGAAATAR